MVLRGLDSVPGIFSNVLFNPLCFFLFENRTASPLSVDNNEVSVMKNALLECVQRFSIHSRAVCPINFTCIHWSECNWL